MKGLLRHDGSAFITRHFYMEIRKRGGWEMATPCKKLTLLLMCEEISGFGFGLIMFNVSMLLTSTGDCHGMDMLPKAELGIGIGTIVGPTGVSVRSVSNAGMTTSGLL
jgi:hypothetical protein